MMLEALKGVCGKGLEVLMGVKILQSGIKHKWILSIVISYWKIIQR